MGCARFLKTMSWNMMKSAFCVVRYKASGKSRAFINDTPASLAQVKELGEQLIDVHSQHQNLLLNKEGFQLNVLDILAHNDAALEKYHLYYDEWKRTDRELAELVSLAEKAAPMKIISASNSNSSKKPVLWKVSRRSWNRKLKY